MEDPEQIRRETFFGMLRSYFFPFYRVYSVTTLIVLIHITFFIVVVSVNGILPSYTFLKLPITVRDGYSRHAYYVQKKFQLWRLLTCVFLHDSFTPLFMTIIFHIVLISLLENMVKGWRTLVFYFITSVLGNLFGIVCSDKRVLGTLLRNKLGTTVPLYGALGGLISHGILEWESSSQGIQSNTREPLIISLVVIGLVMALGFVLPGIDSFGHLGGFIAGILLGFNMLKSMASQETTFNKLARSLSLVLIFLYANLLLFLFFFTRNPTQPIHWVKSN